MRGKANFDGSSVQVKGNKVRVIVKVNGNRPIDGVVVNVMVPVEQARLNVDDDSPVRLVETDDPPVNEAMGPVDLAIVERRMFPPNVYFYDIEVEKDEADWHKRWDGVSGGGVGLIPVRVEVAGLGPRGPVEWACDAWAPSLCDGITTYTEEYR